MSESELIAQILLAHSHDDCRLFRTNAGVAWAGTIVKRSPKLITLMDYHPVKLGPEGFPDLNGWVREEGRAVYTSIEAKFGRNRPTTEQRAFIELVKSHGGRAGVAYTVADAADIIYARTLR
jgi:hypothetical protein